MCATCCCRKSRGRRTLCAYETLLTSYSKVIVSLAWFGGGLLAGIAFGVFWCRSDVSGFKVRAVHDGEGKAVFVLDSYNRPVYCEYVHGTWTNEKAYQFFFDGKWVMQLAGGTDGSLRGSAVTYYNREGKPNIVWIDRSGTGRFTDREIHEGGQVRKEALIQGVWRQAEKSNDVGGVIIDGEWCPVKFTNGAWQVQK